MYVVYASKATVFNILHKQLRVKCGIPITCTCTIAVSQDGKKYQYVCEFPQIKLERKVETLICVVYSEFRFTNKDHM